MTARDVVSPLCHKSEIIYHETILSQVKNIFKKIKNIPYFTLEVSLEYFYLNILKQVVYFRWLHVEKQKINLEKTQSKRKINKMK